MGIRRHPRFDLEFAFVSVKEEYAILVESAASSGCCFLYHVFVGLKRPVCTSALNTLEWDCVDRHPKTSRIMYSSSVVPPCKRAELYYS